MKTPQNPAKLNDKKYNGYIVQCLAQRRKKNPLLICPHLHQLPVTFQSTGSVYLRLEDYPHALYYQLQYNTLVGRIKTATLTTLIVETAFCIHTALNAQFIHFRQLIKFTNVC